MLNYSDGVSSHLFNLTSELKKIRNLNSEILCSGGDSVKRFRDSGISVTENIIFDHSKRSIKNFSHAAKELIKLMRNRGINIVHSHNHYAANIAYYASRFTGAAAIQTIHGLIPEGGFLKHFKAYKYITVNESIRDFLIKNRIVRSKNIKFINQGFRYIGSINNKPEGEARVVCASRLVYEKGVDLFIKAAKTVKRKFCGNVSFLIAGTGEYENKLKKIAGEINADVKFLGNVTNLPELLSRTNIFVMPTRTSEGFPMTLVEAALTKNLIITSEFDSLGNMFKNNVDGLIFGTGNYEELAEKLLSALSNPAIANQMSDTFYNKAKKYFDLDIFTEKHLEVYKECLIK